MTDFIIFMAGLVLGATVLHLVWRQRSREVSTIVDDIRQHHKVEHTSSGTWKTPDGATYQTVTIGGAGYHPGGGAGYHPGGGAGGGMGSGRQS